METKNREMIRYGRDWNDRPKNTLYTVRKDGTIYFGIARTNAKEGDRFIKRRGVTIAKNRANAAEVDVPETVEKNYEVVDDLKLHANGLRGNTSVSNIQALLSYFETIDDIHAARLYGDPEDEL